MSRKFTWDDVVRIRSDIDHPRKGELANVVGFIELRKDLIGLQRFVYTIEFEDGSDMQIEEEKIELYPGFPRSTVW